MRSNRVLKAALHLLAWSGLAVGFYVVFALLFDTPAEFRVRASTAALEREYERLNERYDSLVMVLENVSERDRSVFRVLFESDPPSMAGVEADRGWLTYERLLAMDNRELGAEFFARLSGFSEEVGATGAMYSRIEARAKELGEGVNAIPSIQPIINHDLTLLTASFGLRFHPFYGNLQPHSGVDYTVPEGTPVFATADGSVSSVSQSNTGSGLTVVVDHGAGYQTAYSHLSRASVRKGERVRRGDIIARTGDTGMSLSPHLHYEVRKDGLRVDPVHYFFMELTPDQYQRIVRIAGSGMRSFD